MSESLNSPDSKAERPPIEIPGNEGKRESAFQPIEADKSVYKMDLRDQYDHVATFFTADEQIATLPAGQVVWLSNRQERALSQPLQVKLGPTDTDNKARATYNREFDCTIGGEKVFGKIAAIPPENRRLMELDAERWDALQNMGKEMGFKHGERPRTSDERHAEWVKRFKEINEDYHARMKTEREEIDRLEQEITAARNRQG